VTGAFQDWLSPITLQLNSHAFDSVRLSFAMRFAVLVLSIWLLPTLPISACSRQVALWDGGRVLPARLQSPRLPAATGQFVDPDI
jgi:hypothetical protein